MHLYRSLAALAIVLAFAGCAGPAGRASLGYGDPNGYVYSRGPAGYWPHDYPGPNPRGGSQ